MCGLWSDQYKNFHGIKDKMVRLSLKRDLKFCYVSYALSGTVEGVVKPEGETRFQAWKSHTWRAHTNPTWRLSSFENLDSS